MSEETTLKQRKPATKLTRSILTILAFGFLVSVGISIWDYVVYHNKTQSIIKQELQNITEDGAESIQEVLIKAMHRTDAIAQHLTDGILTERECLEKIEELVSKHDNYYGSAIAYRPYGYDPSKRLYAPYYRKSNKNSGFTHFEYIDYDYTDTAIYQWFSDAINGGDGWGEPYWGPVAQTTIFTYSSVFYEVDSITKKQKPLGVVTVDISLNHLKTIIDNMNLGTSGFGALISKDGVYMYHPKTEYVSNGKTILDIAEEENDNDRRILAEKSKNGESGIMDHISTTTDDNSFLVYAPVELTGWSLHNTFIREDIKIEVDVIRTKLIRIVVWSLLFVLFLCMSIYAKYATNWKVEWFIVTVASICIIISIGAVWRIALNYSPANKTEGKKISDLVTLKQTKNAYVIEADKYHKVAPVFVPTGLYIDVLKFSDAHDIIVNGYIWQKYDDSYPEALPREPTIALATNVKMKVVSKFEDNGFDVIQYQFEAEVRQELSSKSYPLEEERLELQLVQKGLNHNIILLPDLEAYKVRNSSQMPGISEDAFISGWKLKQAYYELIDTDKKTTFGLNQTLENNESIVLQYNIKIQRNFVDAFISNLIPLIIVAIMLFFLLIVGNRIDSSKVFSICIAMFFVIVFSHIDIRGKISAQELFYLEYFFFLTYGLILYVALNSIGLLLKIDIKIFRYTSNVYLLMFWPTILSIILFITVVTFY